MAQPITDEDALISAARAGDTAAFLQLQRIHLPAVWDFAIRCTLDDDAATDVAREVFVRAARRMGELSANAQFPVLLYGLAVRQLAFREPADTASAGDMARFHAWPVGAPEGYVDAQDAAAVWAAMRSYGPEYKALDLYVRRNLGQNEIAGALDKTTIEEADVAQQILWSLATVDAALGPIGDSQLAATRVFAGLKLVEPPHEVAAALWQELRSSFAPPPRAPRVLAVMGIAAIGVLATAGSLKAFTGEEPTRVLSAQELRAVIRTTTTVAPEPSTSLAPGPPVRVTTTVTTAAAPAPPALPGAPVTTTTRRALVGPFVPPTVPTTTTTPGGGGGGSGTSTSSSTTRPSTTVPGTTSPTTSRPSTTTAPPTTSPPTTSNPVTTTTRPTTTTATTTTKPSPTTTTTTTKPSPTTTTTTEPSPTTTTTTAPPTTLPPTTTVPPTTTTEPPPPTTTEPPPTTTTEPPPITTEPLDPVIP